MSESTPQTIRLTPKADRALIYARILLEQVEAMVNKLEGYRLPTAKADLNDAVEVSLRTTLQTFSKMFETNINCPPAYFPGVTPIKPPPHIGDASGGPLSPEAAQASQEAINNMLKGFATQLPKKVVPEATVSATEASPTVEPKAKRKYTRKATVPEAK